MNLLILVVMSLVLVSSILIIRVEMQKKAFKQRLQGSLAVPASTHSVWFEMKLMALKLGFFYEHYLIQDKDKKQLHTLLLSAGFFSNKNVACFLFFKYNLMLLLLVCAGFVYLFDSTIVFQQMQLLYLLLGTFLIGLCAEIWVKDKAQKRRDKISVFCPDAMEMLVICAEAGASLEHSLLKVSDRLVDICPELSEEFIQVNNELQVLPSRQQALTNLAKRSAVEEVQVLATTLSQSMSYGTSIAATLRVVASDTRQKRLLMMEEKAASVPAKMGLPMIILVLFPTLVLIAAPSMVSLVRSLSGN